MLHKNLTKTDNRKTKVQVLLLLILYLGCRALLGLGLYVSKALDAEPADLDNPDDTAEKTKKELTTHNKHA